MEPGEHRLGGPPVAGAERHASGVDERLGVEGIRTQGAVEGRTCAGDVAPAREQDAEQVPGLRVQGLVGDEQGQARLGAARLAALRVDGGASEARGGVERP